jgi:hypothetical protein
MPAWDNTPRRQERGTTFVGDSPELFQTWLERALQHTYLWNKPNDWLLFVNSWNEWAEGAHLEPDVDQGTARLDAVSRALAHTDPLAAAMAELHTSGTNGALVDVARSYYRSAGTLARELIARVAQP